MHRYRGVVAVLAAAVLVGGVVAGAAASRPGAWPGSTAKQRCHYVVKKVHGKKKHVRVCRKAKPRADLVATMKGPSTATFGDSLSYTVTVVNHGPGVALNTRLDSSIDWLPPDVPTRFLPSPISASIIGDKQCTQPKVVLGEAVFSCSVGLLARGASVQMTVSFQLGRIAGHNLLVYTEAHTATRDPNSDNSGETADTAMTGCHPSYPGALCIAPPPPDLNCDDLAPYTDIDVDWAVADPDPHHLDGDHDGVACPS